MVYLLLFFYAYFFSSTVTATGALIFKIWTLIKRKFEEFLDAPVERFKKWIF